MASAKIARQETTDLLRFRRETFIRPFFVLFGRMNMEPALHAGVTEPAKFRTRKLIFSCFRRFEPADDLSPRHDVLFKKHVCDKKNMDVVSRIHNQQNRLIYVY